MCTKIRRSHQRKRTWWFQSSSKDLLHLNTRGHGQNRSRRKNENTNEAENTGKWNILHTECSKWISLAQFRPLDNLVNGNVWRVSNEPTHFHYIQYCHVMTFYEWYLAWLFNNIAQLCILVYSSADKVYENKPLFVFLANLFLAFVITFNLYRTPPMGFQPLSYRKSYENDLS